MMGIDVGRNRARGNRAPVARHQSTWWWENDRHPGTGSSCSLGRAACILRRLRRRMAPRALCSVLGGARRSGGASWLFESSVGLPRSTWSRGLDDVRALYRKSSTSHFFRALRGQPARLENDRDRAPAARAHSREQRPYRQAVGARQHRIRLDSRRDSDTHRGTREDLDLRGDSAFGGVEACARVRCRRGGEDAAQVHRHRAHPARAVAREEVTGLANSGGAWHAAVDRARGPTLPAEGEEPQREEEGDSLPFGVLARSDRDGRQGPT